MKKDKDIVFKKGTVLWFPLSFIVYLVNKSRSSARGGCSSHPYFIIMLEPSSEYKEISGINDAKRNAKSRLKLEAIATP